MSNIHVNTPKSTYDVSIKQRSSLHIRGWRLSHSCRVCLPGAMNSRYELER